MNTLEQHRATPGVTIDQHVKSRIVELGRSIDGRVMVYLDTKFWVLLRRAAMGAAADGGSIELLSLLRSQVARGKAICPISESVFLELLKQSDSTTRLQSAKLIDELSLGVTILPHQARVATEVARFVHSFSDGELHPLKHLVWSKPSYILGFVHPGGTSFDPETELAMQKAFFDHMWSYPLAAMMETIADIPGRDELALNDVAATLDEGIAENAEGIRSFEHVWVDELRGIADLCADVAVEVLSGIAESHGDAPVARDSAARKKRRTFAANSLFYAMKRKPEMRRQLPTLYVEASLHAIFRWNKQRRMKGNDLYDIHHAGAALGYMDIFLTEHSLRADIMNNKIKLNELFECRVESSIEGALAILRDIGQL